MNGYMDMLIFCCCYHLGLVISWLFLPPCFGLWLSQYVFVVFLNYFERSCMLSAIGESGVPTAPFFVKQMLTSPISVCFLIFYVLLLFFVVLVTFCFFVCSLVLYSVVFQFLFISLFCYYFILFLLSFYQI